MSRPVVPPNPILILKAALCARPQRALQLPPAQAAQAGQILNSGSKFLANRRLGVFEGWFRRFALGGYGLCIKVSASLGQVSVPCQSAGMSCITLILAFGAQ